MSEPAPEVRAFVDVLSRAFPRLGTEVRDAVQARAMLAGNQGRPPRPLPHVANFVVDGPPGAPPVPVRGYWPGPQTDIRPGLVFLHGGGFVLCDLDSHDAICRDLAAACEAVVFSVDYRRAPESPFPAAFEDAYAATCALAGRAASLGVDVQRLGVAGDSAGGNLAGAVAIRCRDAGGPPLAAQVLIYPMLDPAQDSESYRRFADGQFVTADHLRWYWECYRGAGRPDHDPYFAPPAAGSLDGLPAALVVVAGCDPLGDDGRAYARRLTADGTPAGLLDYAGLFHGFLGFGEQLPEAAAAAAEIHLRVRELLAGPQPSRSRK